MRSAAAAPLGLDEENRVHPRSRAAALIRLHFWRPTRPGPTRDGRAWTMARELEIWTRLARHHDPAELNGAITQVRPLTGTTKPIRMTWLIRRGRGPALLCRAVAAWHASEQPPPTQATRGGELRRFTVDLPGLFPQYDHSHTEVSP